MFEENNLWEVYPPLFYHIDLLLRLKLGYPQHFTFHKRKIWFQRYRRNYIWLQRIGYISFSKTKNRKRNNFFILQLGDQGKWDPKSCINVSGLKFALVCPFNSKLFRQNSSRSVAVYANALWSNTDSVFEFKQQQQILLSFNC